MADAVYANALKRREELSRQLEEVDQFLLLYRKFAPETFKERSGLAFGVPLPPVPVWAGASAARQTMSPADYARMAANEILAQHEPMTRGQLAEALVRKNVPFPTADVPRYLGTILWRNRDRFINVPGLGYAVREIMTPEYERRISDANAKSAKIDEETKKTLDDVAQEVARNYIRAGNPRRVFEAEKIPYEIDAPLLNAAGDALGRELYDPERIFLREAFGLHSLMVS